MPATLRQAAAPERLALHPRRSLSYLGRLVRKGNCVPKPGLALLPLALLAGCAGYAADYWKSKDSLIGTQLVRYGLDGEKGRCVSDRLTKELNTWQLRQLADIARRL